MNTYSRSNMIGQPEYDNNFWAMMRGEDVQSEAINIGRESSSGLYCLPTTSENKCVGMINAQSIFRNHATLFSCFKGSSRIITADSNDIGMFISEDDEFPIDTLEDDFVSLAIERKKLGVLIKMSSEMVHDSPFDLENYLLKRLAKSIARGEDKAFITGNGTTEPYGLLHATEGAEVAHTTESLTFDDLVKLFYSVKPEYRQNAVWLMNDDMAMKLRLMKDESSNWLWHEGPDTLFGHPVIITEHMPDAEAGSKPVVFGDLSYYWIVKYSPLSMVRLMERFALTDQMGVLAYEFINGRLVRKDAVKVIQISEDEE